MNIQHYLIAQELGVELAVPQLVLGVLEVLAQTTRVRLNGHDGVKIGGGGVCEKQRVFDGWLRKN